MPLLRVVALCGLVLAGLSIVAAPNQVEARPQYLKEFAKKYENLKPLALKEKCNVCHYGKTKKNHNDYGQAMLKKFGDEKNVKDEAIIAKAFTDIEPEKSKVEKKPGEMKTFGELIKEDKLPGTAPEGEE